jgi:hypothetical protein
MRHQTPTFGRYRLRAKQMGKIQKQPILQSGSLGLTTFNEEMDTSITLIPMHPTTPWAYTWQVRVIPTRKRSLRARIIR